MPLLYACLLLIAVLLGAIWRELRLIRTNRDPFQFIQREKRKAPPKRYL